MEHLWSQFLPPLYRSYARDRAGDNHDLENAALGSKRVVFVWWLEKGKAKNEGKTDLQVNLKILRNHLACCTSFISFPFYDSHPSMYIHNTAQHATYTYYY